MFGILTKLLIYLLFTQHHLLHLAEAHLLRFHLLCVAYGLLDEYYLDFYQVPKEILYCLLYVQGEVVCVAFTTLSFFE